MHVKCSSFPISVIHVDKVGSERWRKDMSLHASLSLSLCFPYFFLFMFNHRLQSNSATNDNPTEDLFLLSCIHA